MEANLTNGHAVIPGRADDGVIEAASPDSRRLGMQGNPPVPSQDHTHLVKGHDGQFGLDSSSRLVNNLSWVVGFMELANTGDFAANIWNEVPVPTFAIVLMGIGGTLAAVLSVFAFLDSRLAYRNVRFLRQQRRLQTAERARRLERAQPLTDIDVYRDVTFRELGTEVIVRWFMDLLMGAGAVFISTGTFMAIAGTNRNVWLASNILSGYLGNAPIALYGLVNFSWAGYVFCKVQGHIKATRKVLMGSKAAALVERRSRHVQVFCVINGTATVLGGVGSLMTATLWWGYIILIPVIVSSLFCNLWWRRRVGYSRSWPGIDDFPLLDPSKIVDDLEFAARAEVTIRDHGTSLIQHVVPNPSSLPDVLAFLIHHGLFDIYCLTIMSASDLCDALGGNQSNEVNISVGGLLALPKHLHIRLLESAQECVREHGLEHFKNRERYMAEMLGTYYSIARNADFEGDIMEVK